jgi:hypothetical protein
MASEDVISNFNYYFFDFFSLSFYDVALWCKFSLIVFNKVVLSQAYET